MSRAFLSSIAIKTFSPLRHSQLPHFLPYIMTKITFLIIKSFVCYCTKNWPFDDGHHTSLSGPLAEVYGNNLLILYKNILRQIQLKLTLIPLTCNYPISFHYVISYTCFWLPQNIRLETLVMSQPFIKPKSHKNIITKIPPRPILY